MSEAIDRVPSGLRPLADGVIAAAAKDPRFLAVLVAGSIAGGTPDEYSDLDLVLVCTDADAREVLAQGKEFAAQAGRCWSPSPVSMSVNPGSWIEQLAPDLVPQLEQTVAAPDRDDCLRALHAAVDLYREVRPTDLVRRTEAEFAVIAYVEDLPAKLTGA